jgi:hypothetical protein
MTLTTLDDCKTLFTYDERQTVIEALYRCDITEFDHEFTDDGQVDRFGFVVDREEYGLMAGNDRGQFCLFDSRGMVAAVASRRLGELLEALSTFT